MGGGKGQNDFVNVGGARGRDDRFGVRFIHAGDVVGHSPLEHFDVLRNIADEPA